MKLGSPQVRRALADAVVWLRFDPNLRRLRDVVDTLDSTSRAIFRQRKAELVEGREEALQKVDEGRDMMSILRAC